MLLLTLNFVISVFLSSYWEQNTGTGYWEITWYIPLWFRFLYLNSHRRTLSTRITFLFINPFAGDQEPYCRHGTEQLWLIQGHILYTDCKFSKQIRGEGRNEFETYDTSVSLLNDLSSLFVRLLTSAAYFQGTKHSILFGLMSSSNIPSSPEAKGSLYNLLYCS